MVLNIYRINIYIYIYRITSPIITFFISTFTFKFIKSRRILSGHKPYIRAMIYSPIFVGTICFCCGLDIGLCKFLTYLGGLHWKMYIIYIYIYIKNICLILRNWRVLYRINWEQIPYILY